MRIRSNVKGPYQLKISGTLRDLIGNILKEEQIIDDPKELTNVEQHLSLQDTLTIKCGFPPKPLVGDLT